MIPKLPSVSFNDFDSAVSIVSSLGREGGTHGQIGHKGSVIKNGTEGGGRDFKISVKLCSPMQETRTVYLAPKSLQK